MAPRRPTRVSAPQDPNRLIVQALNSPSPSFRLSVYQRAYGVAAFQRMLAQSNGADAFVRRSAMIERDATVQYAASPKSAQAQQAAALFTNAIFGGSDMDQDTHRRVGERAQERVKLHGLIPSPGMAGVDTQERVRAMALISEAINGNKLVRVDAFADEFLRGAPFVFTQDTGGFSGYGSRQKDSATGAANHIMASVTASLLKYSVLPPKLRKRMVESFVPTVMYSVFTNMVIRSGGEVDWNLLRGLLANAAISVEAEGGDYDEAARAAIEYMLEHEPKQSPETYQQVYAEGMAGDDSELFDIVSDLEDTLVPKDGPDMSNVQRAHTVSYTLKCMIEYLENVDDMTLIRDIRTLNTLDIPQVRLGSMVSDPGPSIGRTVRIGSEFLRSVLNVTQRAEYRERQSKIFTACLEAPLEEVQEQAQRVDWVGGVADAILQPKK